MSKYVKKMEWQSLGIWKENCPKSSNGLDVEEKKVINRIGVWMHGSNIRENIVVLPVDRENFEDMFGGFQLKTEVLKGNMNQSFACKKTQGYYASFILRGLKILDEDVYKCFLVYIYLRELLTCYCQIKGYCYRQDYALQVYNALEKYIEHFCDYCYLGRDGFVDFGLPERYGMRLKCEKYLEMSRNDPEEFIRVICEEADEFWRTFFAEYCIVEYKLSSAMHWIRPWAIDPVSEAWPGYIFNKGNIINMKCHYLESQYISR